MYSPSYFIETDTQKIFAFIKEHAMATVVGCNQPYAVATHLPLLVHEQGDKIYLQGHLMRHTDHYTAFANNGQVLVIFNSVPAYISAGWSNTPATASTVNYIAIHINGTIKFTDYAGTAAVLQKITDELIGANGADAYTNIPQPYIDNNIKAIVGFAIEVVSIKATFKLSQNKSQTEQLNIIQQLKNRNNFGDAFIAEKMIANLK